MDKNISVGVVKHIKKKEMKMNKNKLRMMKKKNQNATQDINIHAPPGCESKKPTSLPQKQDTISKDLEMLFEKVKAKVEALKASRTTDASNIPLHDKSSSTPDKAYSVEKTIENKESDCLHDLPVVPQGAQVTADTETLLQKLEDIMKLSSCKPILKEYADKVHVENPNYKTEKVDGLQAFVSSLTFNGKQYVGDKGRNKKESQNLAARAVILSILDSDARSVISKIIKSKEKMPVSHIEELPSYKAMLSDYANKIHVENPNYKTEKADGSEAFVSSLTFNGKQYVGDRSRNKKESEHSAARAVIQSILDSDAQDVISKIIKSNEKMIYPALGKVHNPCNVQTVGIPAGIQTGYNVGSSSSKGNELEVVVNDNMLKTATQEPCTGNSSSVTAKPVSIFEAGGSATLFVPPNSVKLVTGLTSSKKRKRKTKNAVLKTATQEPCTGNSSSVTVKPVSLVEASDIPTFVPQNSEKLVAGPTSSKKKKRKTKKAKQKVGIDTQVQVAAVPSSQTNTSGDYSKPICVPNNCVSLPGSDNAVLSGS